MEKKLAIERAVEVAGSQQRLAVAIGVTQSLVSQWLAGAVVHQRHYLAIEAATGVSVHELLEDDLAKVTATDA
jgi:DNA-binding transcriptional regulator YdaS (Cro superfamily)